MLPMDMSSLLSDKSSCTASLAALLKFSSSSSPSVGWKDDSSDSERTTSNALGITKFLGVVDFLFLLPLPTTFFGVLWLPPQGQGPALPQMVYHVLPPSFCFLPFCLVPFPLDPPPWCLGWPFPPIRRRPSSPLLRVRVTGEDGYGMFLSRGGIRNIMDDCKKKQAMC